MSADKVHMGPEKQKGLVLLLILIGIVMLFGAYAISGLSINQVKNEQRKQIQVLFRDAKAALLAHAITHMDQGGGEGEMGYLPCPDKSGAPEGGSSGNCDTAKKNTFGYYPWASLETDLLTDNSGSCLRYVVSGSYKNSPHSGMINEDTSGQLQVVDSTGAVVAGSTPEDRVVAIIAAPGEPLATQNRSSIDPTSLCGKDYGNMGAYLEGNGVTDNGTLTGGDDYLDQFIHATDSSATEAVPYNDKFVTITSDEIWETITSRPDFLPKMQTLTKSLAECVARYALTNAGNKLPWAAPMNLADYRVNANYNDDDGTGGYYAGRLPFWVDNSSATINIGGDDELLIQGGCNIADGFSVDFTTTPAPSTDGYGELYENWKDHIFYVLSKNFEPADMGALTTAVDAAKAAAVAAVAARVAAADTANTAAMVVAIANDAANAIAAADVAAANIASNSASIMITAATANATNATNASTNATSASTAATSAASAILATFPAVAAAVNSAANAATGAAVAADISAASANAVAFAAGNVVNAVATFNLAAANSAVNDAIAAQANAAIAESTAIATANNALAAADTAAGAAASTCTLGNCILVNGVARAGLVIYAGSRLPAPAGPGGLGQIRREPLMTGPTTTDANTKDQISNYIENGNDAIFPDTTGSGSYAPVGAGSNDIMYCINVDMSVDECL